MNTPVKALFLSFLLMGISKFSFGQSDSTDTKKPNKQLNKNAIYGNVGVGGFYFTAIGYYERIMRQTDKSATFLKTGFGPYAVWGYGGNILLFQYGALFGKKSHHLETGIGVCAFIEGDMEGFYPLSATVGYRIQRSQGHFLFRMGASFPEAIYMGFGVSF